MKTSLKWIACVLSLLGRPVMAQTMTNTIHQLTMDYKTGSVAPPYQYTIHVELRSGVDGMHVVYERKHLFPEQAEDLSSDLSWSGLMPFSWDAPWNDWAQQASLEAKKSASTPTRPRLGGDSLAVVYVRQSAERVYEGPVSERSQWRSLLSQMESGIRAHIAKDISADHVELLHITAQGKEHVLVAADLFARSVTLHLQGSKEAEIPWVYSEYDFFRNVCAGLSFYADGEMNTEPYKPGYYYRKGGSKWYQVGDGIKATSGHPDALEHIKHYYTFLYKKFQ